SNAVDATIPYSVAHLVTPYYRIVPVGDVECSVRPDCHIAGTEPLVGVRIRRGVIPHISHIILAQRRDEIQTLAKVIPSALRLWMIAEYHIAARIGTEQHAAVFLAKGVAFIDNDAGR